MHGCDERGHFLGGFDARGLLDSAAHIDRPGRSSFTTPATLSGRRPPAAMMRGKLRKTVLLLMLMDRLPVVFDPAAAHLLRCRF